MDFEALKCTDCFNDEDTTDNGSKCFQCLFGGKPKRHLWTPKLTPMVEIETKPDTIESMGLF